MPVKAEVCGVCCCHQASKYCLSFMQTYSPLCCSANITTYTQMSGAVETTEGKNAMQRDLDRLENGIYVNLIRFNKSKCKVLLLGRGNPRYVRRQGEVLIESSPVESNLEG